MSGRRARFQLSLGLLPRVALALSAGCGVLTRGDEHQVSAMLLVGEEAEEADRSVATRTPRFSIDAQVGFPTEGDSVHSIGRSSGWRKGRVVRTCAHTAWEKGYILACQDYTDYDRADGDSGGPVFYWESGQFKLLGIHVGGIGAGTDTALFSAMQNIQIDLGNMHTWAPFFQ